jgi:ABC-type branched-subunit amino acid transport system ATPase component/ABC-type branched-subunit amino acid transport system permease subunit
VTTARSTPANPLTAMRHHQTLRSLAGTPRWLRVLITLGAGAGLPILAGHAGLISQTLGLQLIRSCVVAAAALSLNQVLGYAGQISLAQWTLLGVGSFTSGLLVSPLNGDLPYLWALPITGVVGAAFGVLVGLPALRLRGLALAIATLGVAKAFDESLFQLPFLGGSAGVPAPPLYIGSTPLLRTYETFAVALVLLVLLWVLDSNLTRSKIGRAFEGVRADEKVAASYGVDTGAYTLLAFGVAGFTAAIAGAMQLPVMGAVKFDAFDLSRYGLLLVAIVVIGGLRSRAGVVISAFAFTLSVPLFESHTLKGFFAFFVGKDQVYAISTIVGAVLLIVNLALNPRGLAQGFKDRQAERQAKARGEVDLVTGLPELPRPSAAAGSRLQVQPGATLLEVRGIVVRFGGLVAVDDASFSVAQGQITALVGPNGAGKSTLFDVVTGLRRPDAGRVLIAGRDVTTVAPHRRAALGIGRTFQQIGLAADLTVTENLLLAQHISASYSVAEALVGLGRAPRIERQLRSQARDAVATLGFQTYADTPVRLLSQGQRRIVEIGATLMTAPDLVLLDEPSAGFSPAATEALAERLRDIRDQLGRTVLLIEHNIPMVLEVSDSLVVLDAGAVVAQGDPHEVIGRPDVIEAYLGHGYEAALAAVGRS